MRALQRDAGVIAADRDAPDVGRRRQRAPSASRRALAHDGDAPLPQRVARQRRDVAAAAPASPCCPVSSTRASASVMISNRFIACAMLPRAPMSDAHADDRSSLSRARSTTRVRELAAEIRARLSRRTLHLVCVLKGAFVFLADLVRAHATATSRSTSWPSRATPRARRRSGEVRLLRTSTPRSRAATSIIVEDIVDTGLTLTYLQDILRARGPQSLRTACLLSKPSRRKVDVKVEYIGFTIEDRFVVGYGLDYAEQYRNLPYIGVARASLGLQRHQLLAPPRLTTGPPRCALAVARSPPLVRASAPSGRASAPCR